MKNSSKKMNNKGFTLIELLIAVVILAIIITPLLRLFVLSFKMNKSSRKNMDSVMVAEDIMESIKSDDIEVIAEKFNYPDEAGFDYVNDALFDTAYGRTIAQLTTNKPAAIPGGTGYKLPTEDEGNDGTYQFCIQHIKPNNPTGLVYDALITIDAAPYRTAGSGSLSVNSVELVDVSEISKTGTASYKMPETLDENAKAKLTIKGLDLNNGKYPTVTDDNLFRNIKIKITKSGDTVDVVLNTIYTAKNVSGYSDITIGDTAAESKSLFSGKVDALGDVFIYYVPMYSSRNGNYKDDITIENKNNVPVNISLIKEEVYTNQTMLQNDEVLYRVRVFVDEVSGPGSEHATKLTTNIGYNLAATYLPSVAEQVPGQGLFYLNKVKVADTEFTSSSGGSGLTMVKKDRYFDVNIKIYKSEDITGQNFSGARAIYELTGSTQE